LYKVLLRGPPNRCSVTSDIFHILSNFVQDKLSEKQKPDYHFDEATAIRSLKFTYNFGNPVIPEGPVAFRPTITLGLALSQNMIQNFFYYPGMSKFNAKSNLFNFPF
jgi:hypothetical protein